MSNEIGNKISEEDLVKLLNSLCSKIGSCDILRTGERYGMIITTEDIFCRVCPKNDCNPSKRKNDCNPSKR